MHVEVYPIIIAWRERAIKFAEQKNKEPIFSIDRRRRAWAGKVFGVVVVAAATKVVQYVWIGGEESGGVGSSGYS